MNHNQKPAQALVSIAIGLLAIIAVSMSNNTAQAWQEDKQELSEAEKSESQFFTDVRQITSAGLRSGEGYYGSDGTKMVFQSERTEGNPFYQIFMLDFELGDVIPISPGHGKTTCAWIHPAGDLVMYASTQGDPLSLEKQKAKIAEREAGTESRYSWDYDETYELYAYSLSEGSYTKLSDAVGYDAEGSYSPDGTKIAWASNRRAYLDASHEDALTEREREQFEFHGASVMDIYIMDADGSNVTRITDEEGYDGGPFFSPDGQRICWRKFKVDNTSAEIWTMNIDGSDKRCLTEINETSFAPFYHPSGEYLLFMSNIEGYSNFEIYMIPVDRRGEPVRVTFTESFDGFPTFSPDGKTFSWTSNRGDGIKSQIFTATWNQEAAAAAIAKTAEVGSKNNAANSKIEIVDTSGAEKTGVETSGITSEDFSPEDVLRHVDYLCKPELAGRMTGSRGERMATAYVAAYLDNLGFVPAGDLDTSNGKHSWYQEFEYPAGAKLSENNGLVVEGIEKTAIELKNEWLPLTFSGSGSFEGPLVFAGYGMKAPKTDEFDEYDSFVHLPVEGKWVMVFRYLPEDVDPQWRQQRTFNSQLRIKAATVRDMGGIGLIVVSGPKSKVKNQVIPMSGDSALGQISIPVISISDDVAQRIMKTAKQDLTWWQNQLDTGDPQMGFEFPDIQIKADVGVIQLKGTGRNVVGRLQFGDQPTEQTVVVGAHVDHLGRGAAGSLARDDEERTQIHYGADDNASGVAAMLEIAESMSAQKRAGKIKATRDLVVAGWSGEELGLHGSNHFVDALLESHGVDIQIEPEVDEKATTKDGADDAKMETRRSIQSNVVAYLNMDMVGRFDGKLVLQGLGSSNWWAPEIEKRNLVTGLKLQQSQDTNLPTDASEFYRAGVPILAAFTGSHEDYHTPRDTPDKLNYEKAAEIAKLMGLITRSLVTTDQVPGYRINKAEPTMRMTMRVSLGTSPDYTADVVGTRIKAIRTDSASDKAGVRPGDVVVELAGTTIENVHDYSNAIHALKADTPVKIVVIRGTERIELEIVPESAQ